MKRLMRLAVALYPAHWRARYGHEFEALIEDINPGWRDFWNVVNGGLVMRLTSIGPIPIVLAAIGVLGGVAISFQVPALYRSSATVTLKASDPRFVRQILNNLFGPESHPGRGKETANSIRVAVDERGPAQKDGATRIVVAAEDEDATRAQRVATQLVELVETTAAAQGASNPLRFEMISAPALPTSLSGLSPMMLAATGGAAGLLLGAIVAWFRQPRSHTDLVG